MKKRIVAVFLFLAICMVSLTAWAEEESSVEYRMFAAEMNGVIKEADAIELSAALLLYENGKGEMEFDGDRMEVTQWTLEEEAFFMTMADGSSAGGTIRDGILLLDLYGTGETIILFASREADLSAYSSLNLENFLSQWEEEPTQK